MSGADLFPITVTALCIIGAVVFLVLERMRMEHVDTAYDKLMRENVRLMIGASRLVNQLEDNDLEPVWRPPEVNGNGVAGGAHDPALDDPLVYALKTLFTREEIEVMCADLGVQYEDLGGQGLPVVAKRLVEHARHRGLESKLRAVVKRERPHARL